MNPVRRLLRQLFPDHCSVDGPWFDYGNGTTRDLHRLAMRMLRDHDKMLEPYSLPIRLGRRAGAALWPANATLRSLAILARLGREAEREFGVSLTTQAWQLLWTALRYNIAPKSYYKFRLFESQNRHRIPAFVQDHESGVFSNLMRRQFEKEAEQVDHKVLFWKFCVRHDLPTIPVLAFGEPGQTVEWHVDELPRGDVILKRTHLAAGEGFECWQWDGERWALGDRHLDEPALRAHFGEVMRSDGAVVQPRIRNHPDMQPVAPRALSGVRVLTVLDEQAVPQIVAASIRVGVGGALNDNRKDGGIGVFIDPESGRLGIGVPDDIGRGWFREHPDTGAMFADHTLPMWDRVREIAIRAHSLAGQLPTVGWDVAITADGPMIVEANTLWGSDLVEAPGGIPYHEMLWRAMARVLAPQLQR